MFTVFARRANRKLITKVMMALALSVCNPSLSMATPNEVRESEVVECQFMGKVEGSSGYGKNTGWQPLAKASALDRAEKLGASHVVWEQIYLYSDNHVLWAWNTKALPMNYLDTKTVPKRKIFLMQITSKKQFLFFVAHTPVIKNENL